MNKSSNIPKGQYCSCGCGKPRTGNSKYFSDQCRKNYWLRERRKDKYKAQHNEYMRLYYRARPKAKPAVVSLRPAEGPHCVCGNILYDYETRIGKGDKCVKCIQKSNHAWHNETVKYSQPQPAGD